MLLFAIGRTTRCSASPGSRASVTRASAKRARWHFNVELLGLFAAIALLLSAVGVYGVTSYGVKQRTREIGIRMALGASAGDVLRMVVRETLIVGAIGAGLGVVGALALTCAMVTMLYGVSPTDIGAVAGASVVLSGVAFAAAYIPARRAASIQPITALRME